MIVLGNGYVELVEAWGSDERVVEAARMSTQKGFLGWGGEPCPACVGRPNPDITPFFVSALEGPSKGMCIRCKGTEKTVGDEKLLQTLWDKQHATPFEMAGLVIEVKAPIMVYREWYRHRTQSYNEMSARYVPLPDENYTPSLDRLMSGGQSKTNKQGSGEPLKESDCLAWLADLAGVYAHAQEVYENGLELGIARELARLPVPVARMSKMRASANLRNWFGFLKLRCDPAAQWEIRQCADAVAVLVRKQFPRVYDVARESLGLPS